MTFAGGFRNNPDTNQDGMTVASRFRNNLDTIQYGMTVAGGFRNRVASHIIFRKFNVHL